MPATPQGPLVDIGFSGEPPFFGELRVALTYSWLRARFDDYLSDDVQLAGNAVPGIPPHRFGASARWQHSGAFVALELEYQRRMFADDANFVRSTSQHLVSLRAGYRGQFGRFRYQLHGGVANLLDDDHIDNLRVNARGGRFFEPGWPRYVYAGLTLGYGPKN